MSEEMRWWKTREINSTLELNWFAASADLAARRHAAVALATTPLSERIKLTLIVKPDEGDVPVPAEEIRSFDIEVVCYVKENE